MTKKLFDLQLFNDGEGVAPDQDVGPEPEIEPDVDPEPDEDPEGEPDEDPEPEPVDWGELEIKHMDDEPKHVRDFEPNEVQSLIQKGIDYDRKIPKLEDTIKSFEENPAYKYMDDYMKESGYDDPFEFTTAIMVNSKKSELMEDGVSEERAQKLAEEFIGSKMQRPSIDKDTAAIKEFSSWHQNKFGESIDKDDIPDEVIEAHQNGEDMKLAFLESKLKTSELETEQRVINGMKKKKNKSAPPVKSTGGNNSKLTSDQVASKVKSLSAKQGDKWITDNWEAIEKSGYFD